MNNLDFNKYDDLLDIKNYDGFIDNRGYFYKVCRSNKKSATNVDHNLWADEYMKSHGDKFRKLNFAASGLFTLAQISSFSEALVHIYGFIYYSHDVFGKPLIMIPNPKFNNCCMSKEQNEMLFNVMLLNDEKPYDNPIFTEDNVFSYFGEEKAKTRRLV